MKRGHVGQTAIRDRTMVTTVQAAVYIQR